ncbi:Short-chain dehydrogenase/reductase SDR [Dillenia turbinata]|uniref:Short-chain dehydrogenase/reductase SDR n=1 Tax=Dillenia turbinata TaxID=194707 RepID=A0AAN8ZF20_9MAGN
MWPFRKKGPSGFSGSSTAEEVTQGIDASDLTAIVTGASSGIGTETARVLALHGVHVVMAVRNVDAGERVKESIIKEIPTARVDVMELDLSSMASVRHLLPRILGNDKIEMQFATNHIVVLNVLIWCKYHFTVLRSFSFDKPVVGYYEENSTGKQERSYNSIYAYGQSKLSNILHAKELARHLKEEGVDITANALHPGGIATNLSRYHGFLHAVVNSVGKLFLKSIPQGAATTCYVALNPQVKGVSGEYFSDCNIAKPSSMANDPEMAKKLWDFSMELTS